MLKEDNNLFKFATKETSQDSFFSWVINWFNYEDVEYHNFARDFLEEIAPSGLVNQINDISSIKIIRQIFNIDILLVLNMKDGKQNFLIIENKTNSELGEHQLNTIIYYTKLVSELKNEKNKGKLEKFRINTDVDKFETKVYSVLIKTGIKYKNNTNDKENIYNAISNLSKDKFGYNYYINCKTYIDKNLKKHIKKHIKFINTPNELEKLVNVILKYKHIDSLIENYYDMLFFNLTNNSLLSKSENYINSIAKKGILEENKTHFRTNYMCFECFRKLTSDDFDKFNTQTSHINLDKLNIPILNEKNVIVDTLNFDKGNYFKNRFTKDGIWLEEQPKFDETIGYIYLFTKEINYFSNNTYYTFKGLFRLKKREDNINHWEKCNISKNGKISIKKTDIEKYITNEEKLSN